MCRQIRARIASARGEEWLQTNTLDGQKAHDSFIKVGGPAYFQEFGPAGFHVVIGFANPAIINARLGKPGDKKGLECSNLPSTDCKNVVQGTVTMLRQSRTPDQRLYSSVTNAALSFTQCYVSIGDPDGADIAFTKCDSDGHFVLNGIPNGNWRITVFDQWNDQIVDGLSTPVALNGNGWDFDKDGGGGGLAKQQWHTDLATTTFLDLNKNGVRDDNEPGLPLVVTNNRFRDGSYSNFNNTDLDGNAGFNEIFPLFNWYVLEIGYDTLQELRYARRIRRGWTGRRHPGGGGSEYRRPPGQHRRDQSGAGEPAGSGRPLLRLRRLSDRGQRRRLDRPRGSALGADRRLAGLHRLVRVPRVRQIQLRGQRERRYSRRGHLCLDPAVR